MFKNPGNKLETIAYVWFFIRIIIGVVLIMYVVSLLRNAMYYGLFNLDVLGTILICIVLSLLQIAIAYFESLMLCCIASMTINTEYIADQMEGIDSKPNKQIVDDYLKTIKPL